MNFAGAPARPDAPRCKLAAALFHVDVGQFVFDAPGAAFVDEYHLAGQLGVCITERLLRPGNRALANLGIDLAALESARRPLFRCCTDWTERRPHIAGALGAALLRHYKEKRWLLPVEESRKLVVTPPGRQMFVRLLGVDETLFA